MIFFVAVINLIHISLCVFVYFCFCEVQLSCTNSLYLMQLDFKLKNERNEKENLFMHYLPFSCSSGIVTKCLFSEYFCLSSRHNNVSALCTSLYFKFFPSFSWSMLLFKKRVNCIVDSTVSSLYQTI